MLSQTKSLQVNYEVKGTGEAIVFVHGLGGSLNIWNSQVNVCSRYYKTIAYDLRGSGRTETSIPEYSISQFVEDLTDLLEQESVESAHFIGHSMGTLIVQHFAIRYPEKVKSLALVGGIIEIPPAGKDGLAARSELVKEKGMDAVADAITEGGLSAYTKFANPALVGLVRELLQRNDAEGYAASCRALADAKAIDHQEVTQPVLLVVGDEDKTSPVRMAQQLYKGFPNAKLEVIPDCGHWATIEKPNDVNRALLNFLTTL
ncbi:alpha/beta hydrolase [Aneurinibacillus sp. Ricciae_BoGa-3]|uniref:alpha/beta fold hydrolase n=1 Tax=Aneurinibacillus sp. Ricciae_BoGa-3 TaxID=3022697 RepID=UPI00233FB7EA|nr:alpha/beta hydrolase [Aneurinibacillus sp. Ricciae_BoGa-3]WCK53733.1 alpha/beta hydrolase [Aneurinibacillus sp. Ricciae_BoGa-3]